MVQGAPPRRGVLPHPAGAPEGRAHQEGEADAAAAPPGQRAHALGHRLRGQVPPAAPGRRALPAAREPRLRRRAHRAAEARPGGGVGPGPGGDLPQVHQRRRRRALPQVGPRGQLGERAAGPRFQLLQPPTHQLLVKDGGTQTRRLPREALLWPSPPVSETPLPHTSINPAAAFETADEGYDGVPFPRPPREFTRPSFLPDSDDGGTDPGQALRNDGLDPPRPPTLGGRLRESGIQAAETVIAGAAAGAATRSSERHRTLRLAADGGGGSNRRLRFGGGGGGRGRRRRPWKRAEL